MLTIHQLTKKYNDTVVVNIQELIIPVGQCFGLAGNNGAGKTTLFSLILDLIQATEGSVSINGIDVSKQEDWKQFTSAFLDESFLIGYLTPEEYFYFIGELRSMNKSDIDEFIEQYRDFFHDEILGKKKLLRDLSKGNQKKVGIIASLIGNPKVIILDEPFANLDPTSQYRLKNILLQIKQTSETTILISSHDLMHITEISDRIVILEKGEPVKDLEASGETLNELEKYFAVP